MARHRSAGVPTQRALIATVFVLPFAGAPRICTTRLASGERIAADGVVIEGESHADESLLTGESQPVYKKAKDFLIGGSILDSGIVKAQVTATGEDTVLSGILHLVKQAQAEKPPLQKIADKISAVFVPTVIILGLVTFLLNYF